MSEFDKQMSDLRIASERATSELRSKWQKIFAQADRMLSDALLEHDRKMAIIVARSTKLKMMSALSDDVLNEESDAAVTEKGRSGSYDKVEEVANKRPAREVILRALLEGSLHATDVDTAVIREGWTKAASEKAKSLLRREGLVAAVKRRWSITPRGRKALLGEPGS